MDRMTILKEDVDRCVDERRAATWKKYTDQLDDVMRRWAGQDVKPVKRYTFLFRHRIWRNTLTLSLPTKDYMEFAAEWHNLALMLRVRGFRVTLPSYWFLWCSYNVDVVITT
jgi:hypothetical protein